MAGGFRQPRDQGDAHVGIGMGLCVGQNLEGDGEKRVARQHRRHLIKGDMGGGAAAAQIVIVHAGQIVMHQRIGVQRLRWPPPTRRLRASSTPNSRAECSTRKGRSRLPPAKVA